METITQQRNIQIQTENLHDFLNAKKMQYGNRKKSMFVLLIFNVLKGKWIFFIVYLLTLILSVIYFTLPLVLIYAFLCNYILVLFVSSWIFKENQIRYYPLIQSLPWLLKSPMVFNSYILMVLSIVISKYTFFSFPQFS